MNPCFWILRQLQNPSRSQARQSEKVRILRKKAAIDWQGFFHAADVQFQCTVYEFSLFDSSAIIRNCERFRCFSCFGCGLATLCIFALNKRKDSRTLNRILRSAKILNPTRLLSDPMPVLPSRANKHFYSEQTPCSDGRIIITSAPRTSGRTVLTIRVLCCVCTR